MAREEATRYVGSGVTLFDEMVADGRMPKSKQINSRIISHRIQLDAAFSDLDAPKEN